MYSELMKKLLPLLFILSAFIGNAQRTMFSGNNNFVSPVGPPSLVTAGLVLDLDAGNVASYAGTGTTWTDLSGKGNNGTLVNSVSYNLLEKFLRNGCEISRHITDLSFLV